MADFGALLPRVTVPPPGPASRALADRLRQVESRNVTWLGEDFPVFWEEARGANVRDADGNVYLDLTAAFGVALPGHRSPTVAAALRAQGDRLVHGMGDVHPPAAKVELLERLVEVLGAEGFGGRDKGAGAVGSAGERKNDPGLRAVLASSGSEAVEIALKTAHLATGKPGVIAFRGGYHGLTLGALSATARPYFREPFAGRVPEGVAWGAFPVAGGSAEGSAGAGRGENRPRGAGPSASSVPGSPDAALAQVEGWLRNGLPDGTPVGAVIVEPVQARGGVRIPAEGFGAGLTRLAREHGALLVADEIYTGLGRCGAVLASHRVGLEPDLVCLGKVLGGGLPLSACVGSREVMDAWPLSPGEALHTSTFLGHPLACAAGVSVLGEVAGGLPTRAEEMGVRLLASLREALTGVEGVREVRGMGLLLGIELGPAEGVRVAEAALRRGILVLPAGDRGEVVELSPPVVLTREQEAAAVEGVASAVRTVLQQR